MRWLSRPLLIAGVATLSWGMLRAAYLAAEDISTAMADAKAEHEKPFRIPGFGVPLSDLGPVANGVGITGAGSRAVALRPAAGWVSPRDKWLAQRHPHNDWLGTAATGGGAGGGASDYARGQLAMLAWASSPVHAGRGLVGLLPTGWGSNAGDTARFAPATSSETAPAIVGVAAFNRTGMGIATAPVQSASVPPVAHRNRWNLGAWALLRGGSGSPSLGRGPMLGGTQVGALASYDVDRAGRLRLFGRVNSAGPRASAAEGAAGLSLAPVAAIPVRLVVERRQALHGGAARSATAAYAVGGVDQEVIRSDWRLSGYAAAGVVGARRRQLFAEGSAVVARPIATIGAVRISGGAGTWAAAQPGASRVDVGPVLIARTSAPGFNPRVELDWRQRIAGQAAPTSGLALTLAADF